MAYTWEEVEDDQKGKKGKRREKTDGKRRGTRTQRAGGGEFSRGGRTRGEDKESFGVGRGGSGQPLPRRAPVTPLSTAFVTTTPPPSRGQPPLSPSSSRHLHPRSRPPDQPILSLSPPRVKWSPLRQHSLTISPPPSPPATISVTQARNHRHPAAPSIPRRSSSPVSAETELDTAPPPSPAPLSSLRLLSYLHRRVCTSPEAVPVAGLSSPRHPVASRPRSDRASAEHLYLFRHPSPKPPTSPTAPSIPRRSSPPVSAETELHSRQHRLTIVRIHRPSQSPPSSVATYCRLATITFKSSHHLHSPRQRHHRLQKDAARAGGRRR